MRERNLECKGHRSRLSLQAAYVLVALIGLQFGPTFAAEPQRLVSRATGSWGVMSIEPRAHQQVAVPVRLPPVEPLFFAPIAIEQLHQFKPAPAVEIDLGLPTNAPSSIGGWVGVGFGRGGLLQ